jgi:hypothetical protein
VQQIGEVTGKKVKLNLVPRDVFAKFPFPGAHELAEMFGWFDEYTYHGRVAKREEGIRAFPDHKSFREWLATGAHQARVNNQSCLPPLLKLCHQPLPQCIVALVCRQLLVDGDAVGLVAVWRPLKRRAERQQREKVVLGVP